MRIGDRTDRRYKVRRKSDGITGWAYGAYLKLAEYRDLSHGTRSEGICEGAAFDRPSANRFSARPAPSALPPCEAPDIGNSFSSFPPLTAAVPEERLKCSCGGAGQDRFRDQNRIRDWR